MEPTSSAAPVVIAPTATQPKKISNNNYFVVLLLISLLVVGGAGLATKSFISGIGHDSKVVSAKNKAKAQLNSDLSAAPQLVSGYRSLPASTSLVLKDALPTTSDFPGLISLIEVAGARSGVNVSSIAPDTSASSQVSTGTDDSAGSTIAPQPQSFDIGIQVSGSYAQLLAFFGNLETSARPMIVTGVQLTGGTSSLNANISITTYYQSKSALPFSTEVIK